MKYSPLNLWRGRLTIIPKLRSIARLVFLACRVAVKSAKIHKGQRRKR